VLRVLLPDTAEFAGAWTFVPILCAGLVAHAAYHVFAQAIVYAPRETRRLPLASGTGASLNLIGCLLLVPVLGAHGAAWANVAGRVAMALVAFVIGQNVLPIRHRLRAWTEVSVMTAVALAVYYSIDLNIGSTVARISAKAVVLLLSATALWRMAGAMGGEQSQRAQRENKSIVS